MCLSPRILVFSYDQFSSHCSFPIHVFIPLSPAPSELTSLSPSPLQLPTKAALLEKFGENGEGLESMTLEEKKRLRKLVRLSVIKDNNAKSLTDV